MRGVGCRASGWRELSSSGCVRHCFPEPVCPPWTLRVRAGLSPSVTACSLRAREVRLLGLSQAFLTGAELTWQSPGSILSSHCPAPPRVAASP